VLYVRKKYQNPKQNPSYNKLALKDLRAIEEDARSYRIVVKKRVREREREKRVVVV